VDDEKLVALMFREALEAKGHEVDIAYDGEEGIRKVRQEPFDLVISDLVMPIRGGIDMILDIRRDSPETKVLIVSSIVDSGADYMKMVEKLPSIPVLRKPIDGETLVAAVEELLAE
jgi:DNA-binding response OmpR family regulator